MFGKVCKLTITSQSSLTVELWQKRMFERGILDSVASLIQMDIYELKSIQNDSYCYGITRNVAPKINTKFKHHSSEPYSNTETVPQVEADSKPS